MYVMLPHKTMCMDVQPPTGHLYLDDLEPSQLLGFQS